MTIPRHIFIMGTIFLLLSLLFSAAEGSCGSYSWFGPNCQYTCHCSPNNCLSNGECLSGANKCANGWFGPGCQYSDQVGKVGATTSTPFLTDDDDETCSPGDLSASVQMTVPYRFTWMRIAVKNQDFDILKNITIEFNDGAFGCENMRVATVYPNLLDVHCDVEKLVTKLTFTGEGVLSLCSVYISGGRNLALRQTTSQSSTLMGADPSVSSKVVDGQTSGSVNDGRCTSTVRDGSDNHPTWNVMFSQPRVIQSYRLRTGVNDWSEDRCCMERFQGFELKGFNEEGTEVFFYKDQETDSEWPYDFASWSNTTDVSRVSITATYTDNTTTLHPILVLCEVAIYGDSSCPKGKYGRECENDCNCATDEECFVSTGGCPSGCAEGFYGDDCQSTCPPTFYGENCDEKCSDGCPNGLCNSTTGLCDCLIGRLGTYCEQKCPPGKYWINCTNECSSRCDYDGSCHPEDGYCTYGCVNGYRGSQCLISCEGGRYGKDCEEYCSDFCSRDGLSAEESDCDPFNGTCLRGCEPGHGVQEPLCKSVAACPSTFYGDDCDKNCDEGCSNNRECPPGKYGFKCKYDCGSRCDRDGSCHPQTGHCSYGCVHGYSGPYCLDGCDAGRYGKDCKEVCSDLCSRDGLSAGEATCDRFNGTCLRGCRSGSDVQDPLCMNVAGRDLPSKTGLMIALGSVLVHWSSYG